MHNAGEDCTMTEKQYWDLNEKLQEIKVEERVSRRNRAAYGRVSFCIPGLVLTSSRVLTLILTLTLTLMVGFSCLPLESSVYVTLKNLRASPCWQWTMLTINILNVLGLMAQETDPVKAAADDMQSIVLPIMDWIANIMFTVDMFCGMIVMGLYSYFSDQFCQLDFFVVVTGWLDAADLGLVDFSSFRVLRVLRPLRLIQYFKGVQAIIGSIVYGWPLILNVLAFMCFFLLVFGILGVENFQVTYSPITL